MISYVNIQRFKSIRAINLALLPINVLVGSNGAGKSNFIEFFNFLFDLVHGSLGIYTAKKGGANRILHLGQQYSDSLIGRIVFSSSSEYFFEVERNDQDKLFFLGEEAHLKYGEEEEWGFLEDNGGYLESKLLTSNGSRFERIVDLTSYSIYHFHGTSRNAPLKQTARVEDVRFLRSDGSNLAAFLYELQQNHSLSFNRIQSTIRRIAPFFDRFDLQPTGDYIRLNWRQKGADMYLDASDFSDGTLRFIALCTLLLQPNPPATILIDEPELGLHPYAITTLAGLVKSVSMKTQIILSTQSVNLVSEFEPKDIITVENRNNESVFKRLDEVELKEWLTEYTLGDLWYKNVFGGNP